MDCQITPIKALVGATVLASAAATVWMVASSPLGVSLLVGAGGFTAAAMAWSPVFIAVGAVAIAALATKPSVPPTESQGEQRALIVTPRNHGDESRAARQLLARVATALALLRDPSPQTSLEAMDAARTVIHQFTAQIKTMGSAWSSRPLPRSEGDWLRLFQYMSTANHLGLSQIRSIQNASVLEKERGVWRSFGEGKEGYTTLHYDPTTGFKVEEETEFWFDLATTEVVRSGSAEEVTDLFDRVCADPRSLRRRDMDETPRVLVERRAAQRPLVVVRPLYAQLHVEHAKLFSFISGEKARGSKEEVARLIATLFLLCMSHASKQRRIAQVPLPDA